MVKFFNKQRVFFIPIFFLSLFHLSCSAVNNVSVPPARSEMLDGSWELFSIDYDRTYMIKPFDEGVYVDCFLGSMWNFVSNNGKGSYKIFSGSDCPDLLTEIVFNLRTDGQFSFKKIPSGTKPKNIISGYFLKLENQTSDSFDLIQFLSFGSAENLRVVYHFRKID